MGIINPKKIDVGFETVDKIFHISDIHIRLYKRHEEYKECFSILNSQLLDAKVKYPNSIIFVTGDLMHAKTDLSPELVDLASDFLRMLSDVTPTFLVAGNHDMNLANSFRMDSLTPLVENIDRQNLFYLRDTAIYNIANTAVAVFSIIGDTKKWSKLSPRQGKTNIAICHAPVDDAMTDSGFTITNRSVGLSLFNGFDMVLLGDIHKQQTLQDRNPRKKLPIVAYAGSLIQQNHGESLEKHGWLEWDVSECSYIHHEVENRFGYVTLFVENGKLPLAKDLKKFPTNPRLRLFVKNTSASDIKKIEAILRSRFTLKEFTVNKTRDSQLTLDNKKHATQLIDVHNIEVQNKLIEEYLLNQYSTIDEDLLKRIRDMNVRLNSQAQSEDVVRNIMWKPKLFEFSNMFSYADNNAIDFESMSGVHGLFSPNASGKTAAFDALMFCLYDKTPRAFKASHIINNRKNKFYCQLSFDIDGVEYGIRRTGTRKRNGDVKVDVDFWKVEEGKQILLNAEDRRATNAVIRRYVGSYDDFILTSLSVQNNNSIFIDKGQSDRKDLLSQFIGINIFDLLYTTALDEMKEAGGAFKQLSKEDFSQRIH